MEARDRNSWAALLAFYIPLAVSALVQGLVFPVLDAGISRGLDPETSLAAYSVASSVLRLLAAASLVVQQGYIVLVRDYQGYCTMRRFTLFVVGVLSAIALLIGLPGVGEFVFGTLMGTPPDMMEATLLTQRIMAVQPALSVWQAFSTACLLQRRNTQPVWIAGALGLAVLSVISFWGTTVVAVPGYLMGAVGMLIVQLIQSSVLQLIAWRSLRRAPYVAAAADSTRLTHGFIGAYVAPLIFTQLVIGGSQPIINAGLLRLPLGEISVAGYRVAYNIVFMVQGQIHNLRQTALVMLRDPSVHVRGRNFCAGVGLFYTLFLAAIAFTPLSHVVFSQIIGAPPDVAQAGEVALRIMTIMPVGIGMRQFYSAALMLAGRTGVVGAASLVRLVSLIFFVFVGGAFIPVPGAVIGAIAQVSSMAGEVVVSWFFGRPLMGKPLTAMRA